MKICTWNFLSQIRERTSEFMSHKQLKKRNWALRFYFRKCSRDSFKYRVLKQFWNTGCSWGTPWLEVNPHSGADVRQWSAVWSQQSPNFLISQMDGGIYLRGAPGLCAKLHASDEQSTCWLQYRARVCTAMKLAHYMKLPKEHFRKHKE
jgi:hypothetical protein